MPKLPSDSLFTVDGMVRASPMKVKEEVTWEWLDDHTVWHAYSLSDSRVIEVRRRVLHLFLTARLKALKL